MQSRTLGTIIVGMMFAGTVFGYSQPYAEDVPLPKPAIRAVPVQKVDEFLVTQFRGMNVIGPDDKKFGDVSDILFAEDGKIIAYVVGVGGFLGIGAKEVAYPPKAFTVIRDGKDWRSNQLKFYMAKEDLRSVPDFEPYKPPKK